MRLFLIRHGQTPANVAGTLNTAAPGPGLTPLGVRQAAMIPQALRDTAIDSIYVSRLVRTRLTATPLAVDRGHEVRELPGIHEIEAGSLEDRHDKASVRAYLETAFAWGTGDLSPAMPGGFDGHEFFGRFDADIATIASESENAVVVSHGAAIRVWVAGRAINVPRSYAGEHEIGNTGVIELEGSPDKGWTLLSWQGTPVGGARFADPTAEDHTGESLTDLD
ncbi:MAG: histidine phosphatase family protein [Salinibacterium sp.]|nr:histidine phosphatase family protein [Salinibacterium sp.]